MTGSPFLPQSGRSRRARALARHRRRRRRMRALAVCVLVLVAGAVAVSLGLARSGTAHSSASRGGHAGSRGSGSHSEPSPAVPTHSPTGLALGKPPLALDLSGTNDPVQASFRNQPRAGLMFDLNNGRVLWQLNPLQRLHMASLTKLMTALRAVHSTTPDTPV